VAAGGESSAGILVGDRGAAPATIGRLENGLIDQSCSFEEPDTGSIRTILNVQCFP
jgi:hypothetical protein